MAFFLFHAMTNNQVIILAQKWLSVSWKLDAYANCLARLLNNVIRNERDSALVEEASRLQQKVLVISNEIFESCRLNPRDFYKVAFMPVASYDDESGEMKMPKNNLDSEVFDRRCRNKIQAQKAVSEWKKITKELGLEKEDFK